MNNYKTIGHRNDMEYALFLGFNKVGIYPSSEKAKSAINGKGIWNICYIQPVNGKIKVVSRETVVIK